MSEFNHLMVDLETFGNQPYSAIVSIAAVKFNLETGDIDEDNIFYERIDLQSCLDIGLAVNADTILWWMGQSTEAREELVKDNYYIGDVLHHFEYFLRQDCIEDIQLWGNSARFDLGILSNAYEKTKMEAPWHFRNERDVRTLVSFKPEIKKSAEFKGVQHNPIDDCKYQIEYCSKIYKAIMNPITQNV